jgi:hypothetical protein
MIGEVKAFALPLIFSTTLDGFYFANCVLAVRASPLLEVQRLIKII